MKVEIGQLIYRILGDSTPFTNEMPKVEKSAKKTSKGVSQSFNKIKVAAIAAAAGLIVFFKKAYNEAKDAQEINQKFAVTLKMFLKKPEKLLKI